MADMKNNAHVESHIIKGHLSEETGSGGDCTIADQHVGFKMYRGYIAGGGPIACCEV